MEATAPPQRGSGSSVEARDPAGKETDMLPHLKNDATNTINAAPTPSAEASDGASVAPAVLPARWSGKKTAVAAALAVGMASIGGGAIAAAAPTINSQSEGGTGRMGGPGGPGGGFRDGRGGMPGQAPGQAGQIAPGQVGQPGQLAPGTVGTN